MKVRGIELVHAIAEAAAAEIVRRSDWPESEAGKTFSRYKNERHYERHYERNFVDVDESEESGTLSRGPRISGTGTAENQCPWVRARLNLGPRDQSP